MRFAIALVLVVAACSPAPLTISCGGVEPVDCQAAYDVAFGALAPEEQSGVTGASVTPGSGSVLSGCRAGFVELYIVQFVGNGGISQPVGRVGSGELVVC